MSCYGTHWYLINLLWSFATSPLCNPQPLHLLDSASAFASQFFLLSSSLPDLEGSVNILSLSKRHTLFLQTFALYCPPWHIQHEILGAPSTLRRVGAGAVP